MSNIAASSLTQSRWTKVPDFVNTWTKLQSQVFLKPINNEEDYRKMVALANELADNLEEQDGPVDDLFCLVITLIGAWESENVKLPDVE